MTPISNPRNVDYTTATVSLLNASPTPAVDSPIGTIPKEDGPIDEGVGELLQATATSQGRLNYYYNKFVAACQKASISLFVGITSHTVRSDNLLGGTEGGDSKRIRSHQKETR